MIGSKTTWARKFTPQNLFLSLINLVGGKNHEGYFHALSKTWDIESDLKNMPVKSALSKKRGRISYKLFEEEVYKVINNYETYRRTWRGLRLYATDGDQNDLPRTEDILNNGYRGYPCSGESETHYPRMYIVHCYDVLGGVTKEFRYSNKNEEVHLAQEIAMNLESQSLTLYDRLFFCKDLVRAHSSSGSYFLARLKDGGVGMPEILKFTQKLKKSLSIEIEGVTIHLIKSINSKTGEASFFATNLPRSKFKNSEISQLYALRWEVETANRDLTDTLKIEQWHSKSLNGVLQELFTALWLMNQARIQMALSSKKKCRLDQLFNYAKSNFKLIVDFILNNLCDMVNGKITRLQRRLKFLLRISTETRKRRSRSYPRQIKYSRKLYPSASIVPRQK